MTKTNQYGQQTDAKGHVLKQSEIVAKELNELVMPRKVMPTKLQYMLSDEEIAVLTAYVMDYAHTDWSKSVKHGIQLGRSDAVAMLKSLIDDGRNPPLYGVSELQKVITALEGTA